MFVSLKKFVFYGGNACEVSRGFIAPSLAGAGERGSPGMWVSARPDWVGRSGRELRSFRGMGKGAETPTKAEAGKLKRNVCIAESVHLLWRERVWSFAESHCFSAPGNAHARGLYRGALHGSARAGWGTNVSAGVAREARQAGFKG